MRIYEGSPRQDFEEVLRSVGAFLDQRGMREVLLAEAPDGFVVQGLVVTQAGAGGWSESVGAMSKETLTFLDDDIARFMDEAMARRNSGQPVPDFAAAGRYENSLRVIGRWIDEQKPRDIFFFEQDGAFVLRLLMAGQVGMKHVLAEFTKDDIERMIEQGPAWRNRSSGPKAGAAPEAATQTT
ncbi:MAG: hypothetical protein XU10_C0005G0075 [Chloroflexi bacterium CSP1-4]|jgi:hypothetical protein|nr:MAG: hypothetical protein XU10_C0005G0075 [Chloroflexi bacterium CSP1-4]